MSANGDRERQRFASGANLRRRQRLLPTLLARLAVVAHGTQQTQRPLGKANRGAELHQRLVEIAGPRTLDERVGELPQRGFAGAISRGAFDGVKPREDPGHVSIDQRSLLAKGDRRDGSGGVATEAGQGAQPVHRLRQQAAMLRHDHLRRAVQIARTRVVAEPSPQAEHFGQRRACERVHRGKALEKAPVVGNHGADLRLLQHHLGDPDRVGILRRAPRQLALMPIEPADQSRAQRLHRLGGISAGATGGGVAGVAAPPGRPGKIPVSGGQLA